MLLVRNLARVAARSSSSLSNQLSKTSQHIEDDIKNCFPVPVFKRALLHKSIALQDQNGSYSYNELVAASSKLASQLSNLCGRGSNSRIAYLCPNDATHIIAQWSAWISGQVAVPLNSSHPQEVLEYFIKDSQARILITTPEFEPKLKPLVEKLGSSIELVTIELDNYISKGLSEASSLETEFLDGQFYQKSPGMILYTSGSTGKPKGVVLSHANLDAQVKCLNAAWNIQSTDTILHTLPLNHVHGLINALQTLFYAGGKVVMMPKYETQKVFSRLLNINLPQKDRITLYMGVPTIYSLLIQEYDKSFKKDSQICEYIKTHCQSKVRLMVSGSAPLPTTVFHRWREITGHNLLERYGMTEIGMALSNTLHEDKVRQRLPGFVGQPLPKVSIRIVSPEDISEVLLEAHGEFNKGLWSDMQQEEKSLSKSDDAIVGSLLIKGPNVFEEYWNNPEATRKEFTKDGWFITGDLVCYDGTQDSFKILGRQSCDIIKSRGFKISALEIEAKLLDHPMIEDCAVLGVEDDVYGQKIVALITRRGTAELDDPSKFLEELTRWCESKIAKYSLPEFRIVEKIPRNQMGKLNKAELGKTL